MTEHACENSEWPVCPWCGKEGAKVFWKHKRGIRRFVCGGCGRHVFILVKSVVRYTTTKLESEGKNER